MNKLNLFENNYKSSMDAIKRHQQNPKMSTITTWLLTTQVSLWTLIPGRGRDTSTAEGFSILLNDIYRGLVGTGPLCFPVVNSFPCILFKEQSKVTVDDFITDDLKGTVKRDIEITFLKDFDQLIEIVDKYWMENIKKCFLADVQRYGLKQAVKNYEHYNFFDAEWASESEPGDLHHDCKEHTH